MSISFRSYTSKTATVHDSNDILFNDLYMNIKLECCHLHICRYYHNNKKETI